MSYADVRQKVFRVPGSIVLSVSLSWDFVGVDPVDLDLSAVCFTKEGRFLDVVFFNNLFPESTDEAVLRESGRVDPTLLPYMFLSGDSTVGGEEENQQPGLALAARRRHDLLRRKGEAPGERAGGTLGTRDYAAAAASVFHRLYEEEQLTDVQRALDEAAGFEGAGEEATEVGEEGERGVRRRPRAYRALDDEMLTFVMHKIPVEADVIFIVVTSYSGHDFTLLSRVKVVVHNESTDERVGIMDLKASTENGTANLSAMLIRVPSNPDDKATMEAKYDEPDEFGAEWDLRELNVRTFGYTFVDVLPLMMEVLGVPKASHLDVLHNLPDYSLSKVKAEIASWHLSDVRFGVGWNGEHDVDAFLVFLDKHHNYVDHVYPKYGKLRTTAHDVALHSGDALCGSGSAGDEEFIDLLTYRIPANVESVVLGAAWVESFGAARQKAPLFSLRDIPDLYLRLQNRTVMNPYSMEVDRWPVCQEGHGFPSTQRRPPAVYKDEANITQPVRVVVLGALLKTGTQPFDVLFPDGRRIDQYFQVPFSPSPSHEHHPSRGTSRASRTNGGGGEAASEFDSGSKEGLEAEVPLFQFVPLHQHVPVDPRDSFSRVIPYLQCMIAYVSSMEQNAIAAAQQRLAEANAARSTSAATSPSAGANRTVAPALPQTAEEQDGEGDEDNRMALNGENNLVSWNPMSKLSGSKRDTAAGTHGKRKGSARTATGAADAQDRYGGMWSDMRRYDHRTDLFAIAVQFLEVQEILPLMPDRFQCHGEVWVSGQTNCVTPLPPHRISVLANMPYRSPVLVDRTRRTWEDTANSSVGYFLVHKYDRLRVLLFETASVGVADMELLGITGLWDSEEGEKGKALTDRFNSVECTVPLQGGGEANGSSSLYKGQLRLRLSRVPLKAALRKLQRQVNKTNAQRLHVQEARKRSDERYYNKNYHVCSLM